MAAARRGDGPGFHVSAWQPEHDPSLQSVVDWCREIIGSCRRPFGIDHFDLAIAWRPAGHAGVKTRRYVRLRPADLYSEVVEHALREFVVRQQPSHVAVALFSWGEAAHAALPAHR